MNRITEVNRGSVADSFDFYWDGELMSATYGGGPHTPYTEGQEPDLDTSDTIDPNAGYQPPDTEEPEPTSPPDDYSDPKVGGLIPEDLPGARSVGYYFDKAGNRQQVTDTANPTINYVINPINQYSSVSGSSISNGNEHEVYSFQGLYDTHPVNYYYINDEHLKTVSDTVYGKTYNLFYDALGRCVKRDLNGTTTYYIYDGEKPILEYSSTGIVGRNVYGKGIDEILMRTNPGLNSGQPFYYAQDHEGSVTHLLNGNPNPGPSPNPQTGDVLEKYAYDTFGVPTFMASNGSNLNPNATAYNNRFLFTGREYAATYRGTYVSTFSFYEYRARAYNPILGRFMSEDPKLFDAGDYNLFRYCHNDPIDMTDPMGLAGLPNMPYHWTPELQDYFNREYNKAMADAQWRGSDLMHADTAGGAISIGATGYQTTVFRSAWSALKAGATAGYKMIQSDRAHGTAEQDLTEYHGTAEKNGDDTYSITGPNKGNRAGYVPASGSRKDGEEGYSSTIPCGPNCAGIHYAHPRPGDLIHNHPADMQAAEGAHHGAGVLAVTAAPQRGDPSGSRRPVFEGYNGSTHKLYDNRFFNQFPDYY